MITVSEHLSKGIDQFLELSPSVAEHMENADNPHSVTKEQVGLSDLTNEKQATKTEFDKHTTNQNNPHSVTKEQVGLGNVKNEEQVALSRYKKHISGEEDRHSAEEVLYDGKISVKKRIEEIVTEDVGGTVYHNELLNRDMEGQHPMSAIENAGEILLFEGITEDENAVELCTDTVSKFVDEGAFSLPEGYAADTEILVIAAREKEGIIGDRNVTVFRDNYLFARINAMNWYNTTDKTAIKVAESAHDNDSDGNENVYSCIVTKDDFEKRKLRVTGAQGHRVFWRGIIRIKNILKVEAKI